MSAACNKNRGGAAHAHAIMRNAQLYHQSMKLIILAASLTGNNIKLIAGIALEIAVSAPPRQRAYRSRLRAERNGESVVALNLGQ